MSKQSAKEFHLALQSNNELQQKVSAAENTTIVVQIASEEGYVFTEDELENVMQEAITNEELAEQELAGLAGCFAAIEQIDACHGKYKVKN